jgi:hypothetical protein
LQHLHPASFVETQQRWAIFTSNWSLPPTDCQWREVHRGLPSLKQDCPSSPRLCLTQPRDHPHGRGRETF